MYNYGHDDDDDGDGDDGGGEDDDDDGGDDDGREAGDGDLRLRRCDFRVPAPFLNVGLQDPLLGLGTTRKQPRTRKIKPVKPGGA